jgi:ADP-ribose pyrophosphatase YjhB (NUDIX family)
MKSGAPVVPIVTNRAARPFKLNKIKVGKTIYPNEYASREEFSEKLKSDMAALLDGFEHKPRQKKWDKIPVPIARGIIFKDGKLVAIKRIKNGETYYVLPGGHVEENETLRDAAVREVKEETNITSLAVRPLYKYLYTNKPNPRGNGMNIFLLCQYKSGEVSKTDAEEYTNRDYQGSNFGEYEPLLVDISELPKIDLRPNAVRDKLVKDIKKYGIHLTRPLIYIK